VLEREARERKSGIEKRLRERKILEKESYMRVGENS